MLENTFTFQASDGMDLFAYQWSPDDAALPVGVILVVHGMCETAARYVEFAAKAAAKGYVVYALDLRGHGKTAKSLERLGDFGVGGFDRITLDIRELHALIETRHSNLPVYIFGHSMGSFVTRLYIRNFGGMLAGAILSGTGSYSRTVLKIARGLALREVRKHGPSHRSEFLTKALFGPYNRTFSPVRTQFDWLTRDASEVDLYVQNEYCGQPFTSQSYYFFYDGIIDATSTSTIQQTPKNLPLFIFSGERDPVGNYSKGVLKYVKALQKTGFTDVEYKLYPDARHEMLHELNRDEVIEDILQWLSAHKIGLPAHIRSDTGFVAHGEVEQVAKESTSMQSQSPLSEAQASVAKATRAVHQAESHPTDTTIDQAWNAVNTAGNAVEDAAASDNQKALGEAKSQLADIQSTLSDLNPS